MQFVGVELSVHPYSGLSACEYAQSGRQGPACAEATAGRRRPLHYMNPLSGAGSSFLVLSLAKAGSKESIWDLNHEFYELHEEIFPFGIWLFQGSPPLVLSPAKAGSKEWRIE